MDCRCSIFVLALSMVILHMTASQDLNGCGMTKGCFKRPESCTGNDCIAYVTWENMADGQTRFTMRGQRSAGLGWVGFGLRPTASGMSPAEVYACTSNSEVRRSENVFPYDSASRTIPNGVVTTESASSVNNVISCVFTRQAKLDGEPTFYDISGDNQYYILLAIGNAVNVDGAIEGNKHTDRYAGTQPVKLQDDVSLAGCGTTKGCFKQPESCTGNDCTAYVTWEDMADGQTRFTMRGQRAAGLGWVGFGLRPSATTSGMSPAEVYACTSNSEVRRSENIIPPYDSASRTIPNGVVTKESVSSVNNVISCVFTRQAKLEGDPTFYDISGDNRYYILLAIGSAVNMDGAIEGNKHTDRYAGTQPVKLQGDVSVPTVAPTMPPPQGPELQGCGTTKGCFKRPENCGGDDCTAYVTWQNDQDGQTRFTLRAQASGWVAIGLRSADVTSGMSPADVYACTRNSEVRRSENVSPLNSASRSIPDGTVTTVSASFANNVISCVFTRQAKLEGDSTFFDISGDNQYYILLAIGSAVNGDGSIAGNRHTNRWASGTPTALSEFGPLGGASAPLPKVHGSLMVIAWMGLASIGITLARYFKPMWPDSKLLGQKVWFTIHRACMVSCFLCFAAAFVIIFVHVNGFVAISDAKVVTHAVLGIVSTFLGIVNPIMALFRPHPGTPNRPYFNWAHWGVGTSALLLAWANILLGTYRSESGSVLNGIHAFVFFVVVAFCIFHAVMWIMFDIVQCRTESQGRSNDIPMNGTDSNEQLDNANSDPPPGSTMKKLLLFCYITGAVICVVAVIVGIAISGN